MMTSREPITPPSFEKMSPTLKKVLVCSDWEKPSLKSTRISFLLPAEASLEAVTGYRILAILIVRITLSLNAIPIPSTLVVAIYLI